MTAPTITPLRGESDYTQNGLVAVAAWEVLATSRDHARSQIEALEQVVIGSVFRDEQNETPDESCLCRRIRVLPIVQAPVGGLGLYRVTANFSASEAAGGSINQPQPGGPAIWTTESTESSELVDRDTEGRIILNSVQEPLDPPLSVLSADDTLVAQFYRQGSSWLQVWSEYLPFRRKINSEAWQGIPARCALLKSIQPEDRGNGLYLVTMRFLLKAPVTVTNPIITSVKPLATDDTSAPKTFGGWQSLVVNAGYRGVTGQDDDGNDQFGTLIGTDGAPLSRPRKLDADGQPLEDTDTPWLLLYNNYEERNFNDMELPL